MPTKPAFSLPPSAAHRSQSILRIPALALSLAICAPHPAYALGVTNGLLEDCQPNPIACVSSQDDTPSVFLEPWEHDGDMETLQTRLVDIILSEPHARLAERSPNYMHFELPSDDLELFFPPDDNLVHYRSARRGTGFDFLQNRRRLERIRGKAGLSRITVLRGRENVFNIFETPFDSFAPSAVDADAIIEYRGPASRPLR